MNRDQYSLAEDCPNCGEKDEAGNAGGARMSSSEWGHDYSCCSDACGKAFLNSPMFFQLELQKIDCALAEYRDRRKRLIATAKKQRTVLETEVQR